MTFLDIRIIDLIDIFLVAYLLYQFYMMIKGTVAINIFVGIFVTYLIWLLVKALNMSLLSTILGQVMGLGVIALIIVFQQEIRRFLLVIGKRYFTHHNFSIEGLFSKIISENKHFVDIDEILKACESMMKKKTGALIVIPQKSELEYLVETGERINSNTGSRILETIFFKNSPLHDGAVIISQDKILAAKCVLPVSENADIPQQVGLRHRSAIGVTESTDSIAIVVSEERGTLSYALNGELVENIQISNLRHILEAMFGKKTIQKDEIQASELWSKFKNNVKTFFND